MCGRYQFMPGDLEPGLMETIRRINRGGTLPEGDVRPGDAPPAIVMENGTPVARLMRWGMPAPEGQKLVINARAESAQEKGMFAGLIARHRCLLPANLYYEWTRTSAHTRMKVRGDRGLYMAGLFRPTEECAAGWEFVILTQAANDDMLSLHDRMPLILPEREQRRSWLREESAARRMLEAPPKLRLWAEADEPEQLDLFAVMEM